MARFYKKRTENKGLPAGSLVFIGTKKVDQPTINLLSYNQAEAQPIRALPLEEITAEGGDANNWFNVTGLHDTSFMQTLEDRLGIHSLVMEDVMNTGQRAKFEEFEDHLFITLKMLRLEEKGLRVVSEQLSLVIKQGMIITFQEGVGDTFDSIRERIKNPKSNLRRLGTDYLAYALLDTIVDNYIYLIETLGESIDDLELQILEKPDESVLQLINTYKRELHFILKVIRPVRDLMNQLLKSDTQLIQKRKVLPYYRDLSDLVTHSLESVEAYRTVLNDYIQIYHSNVSYRMNDIMKVLTIFSAIFIPLSFFAGVYGTNFAHFPELQYEYAYPIFWIVVLSIAGSMLFIFKRRGWF